MHKSVYQFASGNEYHQIMDSPQNRIVANVTSCANLYYYSCRFLMYLKRLSFLNIAFEMQYGLVIYNKPYLKIVHMLCSNVEPFSFYLKYYKIYTTYNWHPYSHSLSSIKLSLIDANSFTADKNKEIYEQFVL